MARPDMSTMKPKTPYSGGAPTYKFKQKIQPADASAMALNPNAARLKAGAKAYVAPKSAGMTWNTYENQPLKKSNDPKMSIMRRGR